MAGRHSTGGLASFKIGNTFLSTVLSCNVTPGASNPTNFVSSNSKCGNLRAGGTKSWSGDVTYSGVTLPLFPGKRYENCSIWSGPDSDGGNGIIYSGDIVVSQASATIDIKSGAPIQWQVTYSGDGAMTETTGRQVDTTTPVVVSPVGATLTVTKGSSAVTTTDWELTSISISISAALSGGSATVSSSGWNTYCVGAIDFTFDMTFENDSCADLNIEQGDEIAVTITLSNSQTIKFAWIRINEEGQVSIDNSSAEPLQFSLSGAMQAYNQTTSSYGEITIAGVTYWPDNTVSGAGGTSSSTT